MSKKIGLFSVIGGTVSSIIGAIGACIICAPICGGIGLAGPLVAILGVGVVGFLHKYNVWFIIIGGLLFLFGIFLIIKSRRNSTLGNIENHLRRIKKYYKIEKCKGCDCFQGALTQFALDGGEKIKKKIKNMIVSKDKMHGCLGCEPCPPAEIFSSYLKNKKRLEEKGAGSCRGTSQKNT